MQAALPDAAQPASPLASFLTLRTPMLADVDWHHLLWFRVLLFQVVAYATAYNTYISIVECLFGTGPSTVLFYYLLRVTHTYKSSVVCTSRCPAKVCTCRLCRAAKLY